MAAPTSVKIKPVIARRRPIAEPDEIRLWRRHAHQAGEVITAWNDLKASLFGIFGALLRMNSQPRYDGNGDLPLALWHSIQSDSTQRELLLAAATAQLRAKSADLLRRIRWLRDTIDKLAHLRNDPAHTPIAFASSPDGDSYLVQDWFTGRPAAVNRLGKTPLHTTWRKMRGDLFALSAYAVAIRVFIQTSGAMPLPHRPRLLSLPKSNPRKSRRRRARGKPQRPPPAS
jgi:hypothetical protein